MKTKRITNHNGTNKSVIYNKQLEVSQSFQVDDWSFVFFVKESIRIRKIFKYPFVRLKVVKELLGKII